MLSKGSITDLYPLPSTYIHIFIWRQPWEERKPDSSVNSFLFVERKSLKGSKGSYGGAGVGDVIHPHRSFLEWRKQSTDKLDGVSEITQKINAELRRGAFVFLESYIKTLSATPRQRHFHECKHRHQEYSTTDVHTSVSATEMFSSAAWKFL